MVKAHSQQSRQLNSKQKSSSRHSTLKLGRWLILGLSLVCLAILVVLNIQPPSDHASHVRKTHNLLDERFMESSKGKTKRSRATRHESIRSVDVDSGSNNHLNASGFRPPPPKMLDNAFHTPPDETHYQLIFSTSCHVTQDWQSYLFFFQALRVKQSGDVTRIVSGCTREEEQALREIFKALIKPMSDRFVSALLVFSIFYPHPCCVPHLTPFLLVYSFDDRKYISLRNMGRNWENSSIIKPSIGTNPL